MSEEHKIQDAAEAMKGIVEAVPIYQDALQPAAKEVGVALQTVAKTLHVLLSPISSLVWGYEQIKEFVGDRVAEKLKNVPNERLKSPEPSVAGPALEALKYTGYQVHLRELYAGLLATSIDSKTAAVAHPSFVEIIKQMSPDEALIMQTLSKGFSHPFIDVRREAANSNLGIWLLKHFSLVPLEAGCKYPELGRTYLVNLARLGLIELRENYTLQFEKGNLYQTITERPEIQKIISETNAMTNQKLNFIDGAILLTEFGQLFCYACISGNTHE
jgi:hypothetical protein